MSCDTREKKIFKCEAIWAVLEATGKVRAVKKVDKAYFSGEKEGGNNCLTFCPVISTVNQLTM